MTRSPAIHICLMQPAGHVHMGALLDPALYFLFQFRRLGATVSFERNRLRHDAVNLVFGAHVGFDPSWLKQYSCIIVNLEQIGQGGAPVPVAYRRLLRTAVTVDYDADNLPAYTSSPADVPLVSFGYAPYLRPAPAQEIPLERRPVDVLFIGGINERRLALIRRIEATGRRVHVQQTPVFGSARDSLLRQAKTQLNLHFYDSARFEQVRAFVSLSNGTPLISERHARSNPGPVHDVCVTWLDDGFLDHFFAEEFGSALFYEVMTQQLAAFRQADPVEAYAQVLDFATGVWQAHQQVISLAADHAVVGPVYPAQLLPGEPSAADGPLPPLDAAQKAPLFQVIDDVDHQIAQIIDRGQFDMALTVMSGAVSSHHHQPGIINHALYYPRFDRWIERLAERLAAQRAAAGQGPVEGRDPAGRTGRTLFVATELYQVGGHSRLLESLVANVPDPVVVLTDVFGSCRQSPSSADWIRERLGDVELVIIDEINAWQKAMILADLVERHRPDTIWYLQHQQDAVAFVGTLPFRSCRKLMIHHADHNPSLGCTLADVDHVDLTDSLQQCCTHNLQKHCHRLPLYVPDRGARAMPEHVRAAEASVVTAGRFGKFSLTGAVALQRIAEAALRTVGGRFYHVGALSDSALRVIRAHLRGCGINPKRFISLGQVPSLWACLKGLDAQVYVGSAPFSGGTSAIEAQGCGYPVLPFCGFGEGELVADYSSYADPSLGWRDVEELSRRIAAILPELQARSHQARRFYETGFSRQVLVERLDGIVGRQGA